MKHPGKITLLTCVVFSFGIRLFGDDESSMNQFFEDLHPGFAYDYDGDENDLTPGFKWNYKKDFQFETGLWRSKPSLKFKGTVLSDKSKNEDGIEFSASLYRYLFVPSKYPRLRHSLSLEAGADQDFKNREGRISMSFEPFDGWLASDFKWFARTFPNSFFPNLVMKADYIFGVESEINDQLKLNDEDFLRVSVGVESRLQLRDDSLIGPVVELEYFYYRDFGREDIVKALDLDDSSYLRGRFSVSFCVLPWIEATDRGADHAFFVEYARGRVPPSVEYEEKFRIGVSLFYYSN